MILNQPVRTAKPFGAFLSPALTSLTLLTLTLGILGVSRPALAAGTNTWSSGVSGNWSVAANWSQNPFAPGVAGHTDDDVVLPGSANQTLTLDHSTLSSLGLANMTVRSIASSDATSFPFNLNVSGTSGNPLQLNVGNVGNNPAHGILTRQTSQWTFNWVDLNIVGSPTTHGWEITRLRTNTQTDQVTLNNTNVSMLSVLPNTGLRIGANNDNGGILKMNGGSLTVTNATNNAKIDIGSGNGLNAADLASGKVAPRIHLTNTLLTTNSMEVSNNATFTFDNGGIVGTSNISGSLLVGRAGHVHFLSGKINIGTLDYGNDSTRNYFLGLHPEVNVTGGAEVTIGTINMPFVTGSPVAGASYQLNIHSGGKVTATTANIGFSSLDREHQQVNLGTDGTFIVTNLNLGSTSAVANNRHGAGLLNMTGGTLTAHNVKLGDTATNRSSDGYWNQTGGDSIITGAFNFVPGMEATSNLVGLGYNTGSREFRVAGDATMTLTGAGFTKSPFGTLVGGGTGWIMTAGDWDVSGTLKFDPSSVTTQTFFAFGQDVGAPPFSDWADVAPFFNGNFSVGTLDLSELDGIEKLLVMPAGNYSLNALYVNSLIGLNAGNVTDHLDSPINIFYNAGASPDLLGLTFALDSGGFLIAVSAVPEPSTLGLLALGFVGVLRGRRSRA